MRTSEPARTMTAAFVFGRRHRGLKPRVPSPMVSRSVRRHFRRKKFRLYLDRIIYNWNVIQRFDSSAFYYYILMSIAY